MDSYGIKVTGRMEWQKVVGLVTITTEQSMNILLEHLKRVNELVIERWCELNLPEVAPSR